jgi:hypothetical protein
VPLPFTVARLGLGFRTRRRQRCGRQRWRGGARRERCTSIAHAASAAPKHIALIHSDRAPSAVHGSCDECSPSTGSPTLRSKARIAASLCTEGRCLIHTIVLHIGCWAHTVTAISTLGVPVWVRVRTTSCPTRVRHLNLFHFISIGCRSHDKGQLVHSFARGVEPVPKSLVLQPNRGSDRA